MVDHSGTAPESATPFCQGIKLQFCFEAYFFKSTSTKPFYYIILLFYLSEPYTSTTTLRFSPRPCAVLLVATGSRSPLLST